MIGVGGGLLLLLVLALGIGLCQQKQFYRKKKKLIRGNPIHNNDDLYSITGPVPPTAPTETSSLCRSLFRTRYGRSGSLDTLTFSKPPIYPDLPAPPAHSDYGSMTTVKKPKSVSGAVDDTGKDKKVEKKVEKKTEKKIEKKVEKISEKKMEEKTLPRSSSRAEAILESEPCLIPTSNIENAASPRGDLLPVVSTERTFVATGFPRPGPSVIVTRPSVAVTRPSK